METTARKLRSPLKWHGGKSYLARRIVALFPPHRTYIEPYAGGLNVLLNKPPADEEIVGDLNQDLIDFWLWARNDLPGMIRRLGRTPYAEASFLAAKADFTSGGIDRAVNFVIRNRMSRGGLGKDFAWSERLRGKGRPDGPVPGDVNAWETMLSELPRVAMRLMHVHIRHAHALTLFAFAGPDSVVYCDPPYLHETRTARRAYSHEMTEADHRELLAVALVCRGKVFLSGYRSALYDEALAGWTRHEFDMPNHSGQGATKQRRVECVWESPDR